MKKISPLKMLCAIAMLATTSTAVAGDGTKSNPYTVAELNAQKDALAASGNTVWVKADLKGLGEDGSRNSNIDTENLGGTNTRYMAALFGDDTGTFTAYSYQILSDLEMSDLTNTKDLLISLNYQKVGHPHGNSTNPQYATDYETQALGEVLHFSLAEIHGALSLTIKGGYRGYHIASSYIIPSQIVAARVNFNYTAAKGASINYGYYDGTEKEYIINKNTALVLMADDATYDFVLSAGYYEQISSNGLNGGKNAGSNPISTADRWHFRFVSTSEKLGFERNGTNDKEVILDSKDEIYLTVNSKDNHFAGNWTWETADKKWISWAGKKYSDFHESGINSLKADSTDGEVYDLTGRKVAVPQKGLYIQNGKKYIAK